MAFEMSNELGGQQHDIVFSGQCYLDGVFTAPSRTKRVPRSKVGSTDFLSYCDSKDNPIGAALKFPGAQKFRPRIRVSGLASWSDRR